MVEKLLRHSVKQEDLIQEPSENDDIHDLSSRPAFKEFYLHFKGALALGAKLILIGKLF